MMSLALLDEIQAEGELFAPRFDRDRTALFVTVHESWGEAGWKAAPQGMPPLRGAAEPLPLGPIGVGLNGYKILYAEQPVKLPEVIWIATGG